MNFLKGLFALLLMTTISFAASAQCVISTSCGDYNFDQCSSFSFSEETVNGQTSITITVDGQVVVQDTCNNGNNNGGNDNGGNDNGGNDNDGGFDICDYIDCQSYCDLASQYGFTLPICE